MLNSFNFSLKLKKKLSLILIFSSCFFLSSYHQAIAQQVPLSQNLPNPPTPMPPQTNTPLIPYGGSNPIFELNNQTTIDRQTNTPTILYENNSQAFPDRNQENTIYRVEVAGENPLLLDSVRMIERGAFIRRGEGFIQVGIFTNIDNALNVVKRLNSQGISSRIVQISTDSNPNFNQRTNIPIINDINSNSNRNDDQDNDDQNVVNSSSNICAGADIQGFFVIIPAQTNTLNNLTNQVRRLGVPNNSLQSRNSPLGLHLAVGPFIGRDQAEKCNNFLRSAGFDARVYAEN